MINKQQPWVKMVTLGAVISAIAVQPMNAAPTNATPTNDGNGCFLVTSSGRTVNLDKLCGNGNTVQLKPSTQPVGNPANNLAGMVQAKIKRRMHGIPVIDVTFNGNRTFEMVVDTGASGTLITDAMARALNVPVVGAVRSTIADGSTVVFPLGRVASMSVSGATVKNVTVAIAQQADVGLLGHDFFDSYDVKIKRDVVEFYRR